MYKLSQNQILSKELISKYIELDTSAHAKYDKLYQYYIGKNDILKRVMQDVSKPNHKIVNPYAHYITDMMTGYFMGEPVKYNGVDEELLSEILAINNYNDEADENKKLELYASIFGISYELMYLDVDSNIRYKALDPRGCIPIFANDIEGDLLHFIRYYDDVDIITSTVTRKVEVYDSEKITYYTMISGVLTMDAQYLHAWGMVPVNIYRNNEETIGDFETVISLIDAYDVMESDSINEMDYFSDSYLKLKGMMGTNSEDVASMKENRVLLLPDDGDADFLQKSINDTYIENEKTRLDNAIHTFSYCPAMTDKDFAANASGVAMKYKLMGLENATAKKESSFKVGLQRRIEQICNILTIMRGTAYDYRSIDVVFTRNIPTNIVEITDTINKLGSLLSDKTKMAMLPLDINYEKELQQKESEMSIGYDQLALD